MRKTTLAITSLLMAASLFSCGKETPAKTVIFEGRELDLSYLVDLGEESFKKSVKKVNYTYFAGNLATEGSKRNFIVVVHSSNKSDCTCWVTFRDQVLIRYIVNNQVNVYWLEPSEFQNEEKFGMDISDAYATIGIFENGKLKATKTNQDEFSPWATTLDGFSAWMDERVDLTHMGSFFIEKDQLDAKYNGTESFTVDFGRITCPDCAFLDTNDLHDYYLAHEIKKEKKLYIFDVDVKGVRYNEAGEVDSTLWTAFKNEYGLATLEKDDAGYKTGYVPTLFNITPNKGQKTGSVITGSAVFYNDTLTNDEQTGVVTITDSYFTSERLNTPSLKWLKDSNVETKVLQGLQEPAIYKTIEYGGQIYTMIDNHWTFNKYTKPIIYTFLETFTK